MKHDTFDGNFAIISPAIRIASAMKYYRSEVPLRTMGHLGLAKTHIADKEDEDADEIHTAMLSSDVIAVWRPIAKAGYDFAKVFCDLKPISVKGRTLYPPIVAMDCDDATDYVHPFNPVFSSLGVRGWDGEILEAGASVEWTNKDGSKVPIWVDKKTRGQHDTIFDIERNKMDIGFHYDIARMVAGVTTTCEPLAALYREQLCPDCRDEIKDDCAHTAVKNVYVFPNSVIPEDYFHPALVPHEGVRILWEGGASHMDSWFQIKDAFVATLKENPTAKLVCFGHNFPWMQKEIPAAQYEWHPWVDYAAYKMKRTLLDIDVNFCPLVDMMFTRCKSAIRWYEGSLGPKPEAALAAKCGPYLEIENGETGLLYNSPEEMKEMLTELIKSAELRKDLAAEGQKWVLANRHAEKTVPGLLEFYKELKARQRMEGLKPSRRSLKLVGKP